MLAHHKQKEAACTIAVLDVPLENASRFGIMNANPDGSIYEFEEKPKHPKSTKASMGIYIFTWEKLKKYLILDEEDKSSSNDFGKNIIPAMLINGERLFTYEFDGYWKDVGTISSLWEANMDILDPASGINLNDRKWKIYARNTAEPSHYVGERAVIRNSVVSEGCEIFGFVENSVISRGAHIEDGATIHDSIIMPGAVIRSGAVVRHAIVGWNAEVGAEAVVGSAQSGPEHGEWKIAVVGPDCKIATAAVVEAGEMVYGG